MISEARECKTCWHTQWYPDIPCQCPCHTAPQEGSWEERFDKEFKDSFSGGDMHTWERADPIKDFISSELSSLKKRIQEKLERKRDVYDDDCDSKNDKYRIEGYNKALVEAIKLIEEV